MIRRGMLFAFTVSLCISNLTFAEPANQQKDLKSKNPSVGNNKVLAHKSIYGENRIPQQDSFGLRLPPLITPTTQLSEIGNGSVPKDSASLAMINSRTLPEGFDRDGRWIDSHYHWNAANTYSHPLYFEDAMLERHALQCKHGLQPLMSGARFFTTIPLLPYVMTVQRPCDTYHSLGYYRPGSRAPCLLQRPPFQRDAVIQQAATVAGAVLLIP